jgi:hypothetical protein
MDVELTCKRCDFSWKRRTVGRLPKQCPHCKSIRWNKDYVKRRPTPSTEVLEELPEDAAPPEPEPEPPETPEFEPELDESTEELWLQGKL